MSNKYLPAGTNCILRDPDGNTHWYKTKVEVDAEFAAERECPRTGRTVLSVAQGKYSLFFPPECVCLRRADIPQMSILNYDIPTASEIANPSGRLRRVAVRTTLSGWVVPSAAVPWPIINELREAGAVVTLYRFDPAEGPALLAAVENALRTQIRDAAESAEASAESAAEQYANSDKPARGKYFEQRIATAAKQAADKLDAYAAAAKVFGFDADLLGRQAAAGIAQAIQTGVYVRAERYVAAVEALRAQNTTAGTALADAASDGRVPAGIVADAVEDNGGDAAELRAAFADADVFSLGE